MKRWATRMSSLSTALRRWDIVVGVVDGVGGVVAAVVDFGWAVVVERNRAQTEPIKGSDARHVVTSRDPLFAGIRVTVMSQILGMPSAS